MGPGKATRGRMLVVGPEQSAQSRRMSEQAALAGWDVRRAGNGFEALDQLVQDAALEAVLVELEPFRPRSGELVRAIESARPGLPVFLVCPAWLEPEARRSTGGDPAADYLVAPLGPGDWQVIERVTASSPSQPEPGAKLPAAGPLEHLDRMLDRLGSDSEEFLEAAAGWASTALGGQTVRIRWAGRSAKHPPEAPEPPADQAIQLISGDGQAVGELVVADRGVLRTATARKAGATLSRFLAARERLVAFRQMAYTDPLSGAHNRRYLMELLDRLIARAQREHFRITLLMFDIDDFKHYNDQYGHSVGDEIIIDIARLMQQCCRPHDVVARIGGDEFAVVIWDAGPPRQPGSQHPREAYAVANRFRKALAGHRFRSLGPRAEGTLTISGGLASYPGNARFAEDLLAVAGEGLIAAKRSGKDRIYLVGREPGEPDLVDGGEGTGQV